MSLAVAIVGGAGKLATNLVEGLLRARGVKYPGRMLVSSRDAGRRQRVEQTHSLPTFANNSRMLQEAGRVTRQGTIGVGMAVLSVKPDAEVQRVVRSMAPIVREQNFVFVSLAAGLTIDTLQAWLGSDVPIVRAMPNTLISARRGMTLLCSNDKLSDAQLFRVKELFEWVGKTRWIPEKDMDPATVFSGCSPAIFWQAVLDLVAPAAMLGMDPQLAETILLTVMAASATVAIETGRSLRDLIADVRTEGGVTDRILKKLAAAGMENHVAQALTEGVDRCREIGRSKAAEPLLAEVTYLGEQPQARVSAFPGGVWYQKPEQNSEKPESSPLHLVRTML